jgi:hypothetical protein
LRFGTPMVGELFDFQLIERRPHIAGAVFSF